MSSRQADAKGTATAMVVPVCFMIAAWSYALCVNFVPSYRTPADKIGAATIGIESAGHEAEVSSNTDTEVRSETAKDVHETV